MIIKQIQSDTDYNFIKTNQHLGDKIIFLTLGGSHAYGTNIEGSDIDLRGCALNSKEEILLGKDFEQVNPSHVDANIYSFNKLIKLLTNCNPNTIELLGNKPEFYWDVSEIGKQLLLNKDMFISQKAVHSFGGYASSQLWRLNNKANRKASQSEQEKHILKTLENASVTWKEQFFKYPEDSIKLYIDKAYNSDYDTEIFMDVNLNHYPLRDYKGLWISMNNIVKEYNKIGARNSKAIEKGKLGKHMMHLVRLYYMCFDILEKGEINTYRYNDKEFLLKIRNGLFLDENNQPKSDFFDLVNELDLRMEYDKKNTSIPETPNYKMIDNFRYEVNEKIIKGEI